MPKNCLVGIGSFGKEQSDSSVVLAMNIFTRPAHTIVMLVILLGFSPSSEALRKRDTWTKTTKIEPDAQAGGWFINLGISGARAKITLGAPKALEVAYVFEGTPAHGKLTLDVIRNEKATKVSISLGNKYGEFSKSGRRQI